MYMVPALETTEKLQPCEPVTKPRKHQKKYRNQGRGYYVYNNIYMHITIHRNA